MSSGNRILLISLNENPSSGKTYFYTVAPRYVSISMVSVHGPLGQHHEIKPMIPRCTSAYPNTGPCPPYLDRRVDDKIDAGHEEGEEPEEPGVGAPAVPAADAQLEVRDGRGHEDGHLDRPRQKVALGRDSIDFKRMDRNWPQKDS